ncbi:MAG: hypothetical protein P8R42_23120 [Candidatus Binatia bacterium]|nr:hypothetical protein [Candidatus Binatia bacterium]
MASDPLPDWPAQTCAMTRIKLIAKVIKLQTNCLAKAHKKAKEVDPDCIARADAKLDLLWAKNDQRSECTSEVDGLLQNVHDLIDELRITLTDNAVLGLDPEPLNGDDPRRLVFAVPLCNSVREDFMTDLEWREHWISTGCFPNFLADVEEDEAVHLEDLLQTPTLDGQPSVLGEYCDDLADYRGYFPAAWPATFDVWASAAGTDPANRFERAAGNYVLPQGSVVANGWDDLVDGTLDILMFSTVDGSPVSWGSFAGTGTAPDGTEANHCDSWTNFTEGAQTTFGNPVELWNGWWTQEEPDLPCNLIPWLRENFPPSDLVVYCFQQTGPDPNLRREDDD